MRILAFLIVVILGGFLWGKHQESEKSYADARAVAAKAAAEDIAARLASVKLVDFSWSKSGFGRVALVDFTLKNSSAQTVKDIVISCQHIGKSGTVVGTNIKTIFDRLDANRSKTFHDVNVGILPDQTDKTSCSVVGFLDG